MRYVNVKYSDRFEFFDFNNGFYEKKKWCISKDITPFLYPDKFYRHLETNKRYSLWIGGNGSAKSTSKARNFLRMLLRPKFCRILVVRHFQSDIRNSVFLMLKGIINKEKLNKEFAILEGTMSIICLNTKNVILTAGLDDTGKLSGIDDITDIWLEEPITRSKGKIKMISQEEFQDLDSRLRMPNAKLTMHLTLNPISKNFFIYKNLLDPAIKNEDKIYDLNDWDICNSTYLDNPFLPESYKKLLDSFTGIRAQYGREGTWVEEKTGSEWLDKFSHDIHVKKVPYIKDIPIHSGFDFNLLPYQTNVLLQLLRKQNGVLQIRVFKEYCMKPPLNTPENACKALKADYLEPIGYNSITVYGDASARHGYDGYRGIFEEYEPYLHEDSDKVLRSNGYVATRRDMMNEILSGNIEDIEFVIDEECYNTILDLETLQTAPDGFDNEKKNGVEQKGHCYSALTYILAPIFPHLLKENKGR